MPEELTFDQKYEKGVAYRLAGNEAFKRGDLTEALGQYHHALVYLKNIGGLKDVEQAKDKTGEQLAMVYTNFCVILAKQEKWERVRYNAEKALEMAPDNTKAIFRRGQAYSRLGKFDVAKPILNAALKKSPGDPFIVQELAYIKAKEKEEREKTKEATKAAFWGKLQKQNAKDEKEREPSVTDQPLRL